MSRARHTQYSVDSPTAAPPLKRVRMNEKQIQTSETIETLEKKDKDQSDQCAKLQDYREKLEKETNGKRSSKICKWPSRKKR